jgi:hypothetical protein
MVFLVMTGFLFRGSFVWYHLVWYLAITPLGMIFAGSGMNEWQEAFIYQWSQTGYGSPDTQVILLGVVLLGLGIAYVEVIRRWDS